MWKQWANALLGLLVVIFAYMGGHVLRFVIAGVLIIILSVWSAMEKPAATSRV